MLLNEFDSIDKLFFTLTVIILTTNLIYLLMAKFNRPLVLGGILSGVIITHLHIPAKYFDINTCAGLGQMGIVLFMMMVGNQLNYKDLFKNKFQMSFTFLNMLIPFILGIIATTYLIKYNLFAYFDPHNNENNLRIASNPHLIFMFKVFLALTVSMTAFPILSMFLRHTNLIETSIGKVALLCGFISELFFWIILGVVLVSVQQNEIITAFKPLDIVFYLLFIVLIAPKLSNFIVNRIKTEATMLGFLIVGCFIFAALADAVDLHQVFGGFLFGLILPRNHPLIIAARSKINELVSIILLPIYFVETGIATNINISWDASTLYLIIIFTSIALAGKFGGAFLTGKILGYSNKESTLLGSLLNIRGVIEVVLLNIGLDIGIINDKLYTILLAMTLICTFLATSISLYLSKFYVKPAVPPA